MGDNMDLKCKKLDCRHNNRFSCECKSIKVDSHCECSTYEKSDNLDEKQKQDVSKTMFEVAPDIHPYRHKNDIEITCDARNCLFNSGCNCHANGISVNPCSEKPTCVTNIQK